MLQESLESPTSEFCVLYGRRRIGKSTLLEEFVKDKPAFFLSRLSLFMLAPNVIDKPDERIMIQLVQLL